MIEPIGWLIKLQFVATDACVTPRCRGQGSSSSFSRKNRRMCERMSACVRAPLLFLYNILLNSEYKFLWVARWCVREVPRDRFNASEKKTSLELATWLFLSNAPLTVRYVYDGASYCTYTAVLPPFRFYRAYLKILVFPFYKAQFGCFPSHVQIPRCIKSLHASIKRKLTNACTLCMHALQLMH